LAWRGHATHRTAHPANAAALVRWAESPNWLERRRHWTWLARFSPLLLAVLVAGDFFDVMSSVWWELVASFQVLLSFALARRIHAIFREIDCGEQQLRRFADMLAHLESWPVSATALVALQRELTVDGHRAHVQLTRLRRRLDLADLRYAQV